MRLVRYACFAALSLTMWLGGMKPVSAQEVEAFFRGKTVTISVGAPPGGSFDGYARLVARHLGKHIEGRPLVVVKNVNGAAGAVAAAFVAHVAPKDGTQIAAVQGTTLLDPVLKETSTTTFVPTSVSYLGSAATAHFVCVVRSDAAASTLDEMQRTTVVIGGASADGFLSYIPVMLNNVLGTKFKVISGYPGSREIILAMQKREVEGMCGIPWASLKLQYGSLVESHEVKIFLQESERGIRELNDKGVPMVLSFAKEEHQRRILSIVNSQQTFAVPYFVAAEVPQERLQILRKAFAATLRDPELLSDAAKLNLDIDPISGEEVQSILKSIYSSPQDLIKDVRKAIKVQ